MKILYQNNAAFILITCGVGSFITFFYPQTCLGFVHNIYLNWGCGHYLGCGHSFILFIITFSVFYIIFTL